MIESVRLQNFQAHTDTTLEFDKGVNIIVGRSDQGKSSIIRAIRWVVENRPTGIAFRRRNTDMVSVTLTIDGHTIIRDKSDKINRYQYLGNEYKALRADVPPIISNVLNFGLANIQTQHEQYFLLQSSAGDAAKTINRIANLQIIGETIRNVNSYISTANHKVQNTEELIATNQKGLAELQWVDAAVAKLAHIKELEKQYQLLLTRVSALTKIYTQANACLSTITAATGQPVAQKLATIRTHYAQYTRTTQSYIALTTLVKHIAEATSVSQQRVIRIDLNSLRQKCQLLKERKTRFMALTSIVSTAITTADKINTARGQYVEARKQQRVLKQSVKICPTCGQIIQ